MIPPDDSLQGDEAAFEEMAKLVAPEFSKREIVAAGKALAGSVPWDDDAYRVFQVAHNWREAFAYPMHRVRLELRGRISRNGGIGLTAARLRRMQSIRRKLRKGNLSLYQMQDIGGCRAILPDISKVNEIVSAYRDGFGRHNLH